MLSTQKTRRRAHPEQSVPGMQKVWELFFVKRGTRHIAELLRPLANVGWKTAPRCECVAPLSDLYRITVPSYSE